MGGKSCAWDFGEAMLDGLYRSPVAGWAGLGLFSLHFVVLIFSEA